MPLQGENYNALPRHNKSKNPEEIPTLGHRCLQTHLLSEQISIGSTSDSTYARHSPLTSDAKPSLKLLIK